MQNAGAFKTLRLFGPLIYYKRLYHYVGSTISVITFCYILIGILDAVGILMVLPLLQIFQGQSTTQIENPLYSGFIDLLQNVGLQLDLQTIVIAVVVVFSIKGLITYLVHYYLSIVKGRLMSQLRGQILNWTFSNSAEFLDPSVAGHTTNLITQQVNGMVVALNTYSRFLNALLVTLVLFALVTAVLSVYIAVIFAVGAMLFLLLRYLNKWSQKNSRSLSDENSAFTDLYLDSASAITYLSATNQDKKLLPRITESVQKISTLNVKISNLLAITTGLKEPLFVLIILSLMGVQYVVSGEALPEVLTSLVLFYRFAGAAYQLQYSWQSFLSCTGSIDIIDEEYVKFTQNNSKSKMNHSDTSKNPSVDMTRIDSLRVEKLTFEYNKQNIVLQNFDYDFPSNGRVKIVGPSGVGKSTLLHLLMGIISPKSGEIYVNDVPLQQFGIKAFRDKIGYLPQAPFLFKGTLMQNITLDFSGNSLGDKELLAYLKMVRLEHLADSSNDDSANRDIRSMVSGGEMQRICLLREMHRKPRVIFLDEPDSSLDEESLEIMNSIIDEISKTALVIEITHRAVAHDDIVIHLRQVNSGT